MKRIAMAVGVIALMPLLMGAGGSNPGVPTGSKIGGPQFDAIVVLDPHAAAGDQGNQLGDITTRAKQATIRISRNTDTAGAMFDIPNFGFPLFRGCDLGLTEKRFLLVPLTNWIPEAVVNAMFSAVGITVVPGTNDPVIVRIDYAACTSDPDNPGPVTDGGDGLPSEPGILSFHAVIRFLVPK